MNRSAIFEKREWPAWAADALALFGFVVFFAQALIFAHTTISNLDEGAYLLKGILFASGEYRPFDPGISTNKAPLAFLIPGYVQLLFGAGLRTGRYLAVFFGCMTVLGTWVASRRLGGKWLAAGSVWILAASPMVIKIYSGGATQSTVACMLAWSLALSLGERRASWQLALSGILAALILLIRQNMVPVLPLLAIYAFWQHGWKALWLLLSGMLTVGIVFFIYWPDILQLWTWLPLIRFPSQVIYSGGGGSIVWNPEITTGTRYLSIFQAFRFHFVALCGSIVALFLWPRLDKWKSRVEFRMVVFLMVLFWGLVFMHSLAAIGRDYCVFCFTPYIAFFNVAGILLVVVSVKSWNWQPSPLIQTALIAMFLVLFTGVTFSAFEDIGSWLLGLPAPRVRDLKILPGFVTWWDILSNGFHLTANAARKSASAIFGLCIGGIFTFLAFIWWRRARLTSSTMSPGTFYASIALIFGAALSPILSRNAARPDCDLNVISANEQIGVHLRSIIPEGSLVYWNGGLSTAPLLYLPGVEIFPAQINNGYSFISHGNTAELFKFGLWNEEMDAEWKATADFFILEEKRYSAWKSFLNPEQFDEFERTAVGTSCLEETHLRIFRRK